MSATMRIVWQYADVDGHRCRFVEIVEEPQHKFKLERSFDECEPPTNPLNKIVE